MTKGYGKKRKEGKKRMGYINPLFSEQKIIKKEQSLPTPAQTTKKVRATRIDKKKNIKFPVNPIVQMKLKKYGQAIIEDVSAAGDGTD